MPSIPRLRGACSPRPATRTASRSPSTGPMGATLMTTWCCRQWPDLSASGSHQGGGAPGEPSSPGKSPTYRLRMILIGNSATTGEASFGLRCSSPRRPAEGHGRLQPRPLLESARGRGAGPGMATIDDTKREPCCRRSRDRQGRQAIVPCFTRTHLRTTQGLQYTPRSDGYMRHT